VPRDEFLGHRAECIRLGAQSLGLAHAGVDAVVEIAQGRVGALPCLAKRHQRVHPDGNADRPSPPSPAGEERDRALAHENAAFYVDRILRGAKPAELPVQFPTKFEMVVNRKTANALGLAVPPSILLRADEVIE
jgi:hypothetical protein